MHSTIALGFFASLGLLATAHPFPAPKLNKRGICHFDDANPLLKRQSGLSLTNERPSDLTTPLDEVWEHTEETRPADLDFANYAYDQIIAGEGKINYCVRWESSNTVSQAERGDIETALQRSFKKWVDVLAGYDGWPYDTVDVNVVGWAVTDESLLGGATDGIDVYTTTDGEGAPECDPSCGRFFNQDGDYSGCAAGAERHYDMSLWLTDGFSGGAGGDWGQRMGSEYFMGAINDEDIHIHLHEVGHTFALDDFYDWTPTGTEAFIMNAGGSMTITEFDAWMARDWWTKAIKSRYPNTGSSGSSSGGAASSSATQVSAAATSAAYSSVVVPPASFPAPLTVSSLSTLSSVVSAQPTGYYPGGNGTAVAPTGSGVYPTGSGVLPTGTGAAYPAGTGVGVGGAETTPCPGDAETSPEAEDGPTNEYGFGRWGKSHRVKHDWRD